METVSTVLVAFALGVLSSLTVWALVRFAPLSLAAAPYAVLDPKTGTIGVRVGNTGLGQLVEVSARIAVIERVVLDRPALRILHELPLRSDSIVALDGRHRYSVPWAFATYRTLFTLPLAGGEVLSSLGVGVAASSKRGGDRRLVVDIAATNGLTGTRFVRRFMYAGDKIVVGRYGRRFDVSLMDRQEVQSSAAPGAVAKDAPDG